MDAILQIPVKIIKKQELIIGPLAWYEASKVPGLKIDLSHNSVSFEGNAKDIINLLVARYEKIFGRASYEVCRDSVQDLVSKMKPDEIPSSLK
jgi:hypothetical protein